MIDLTSGTGVAEAALGPVALLILGAGGDLTWRKLVPALHGLHAAGHLPRHFGALGIDHKELDDARFRSRLREGVERFSNAGLSRDDDWSEFASKLRYTRADFSDRALYEKIADWIQTLERAWGSPATRIFYLAIPPPFIEGIVENLGAAGLARDRERSRIVVEKPFGRDLKSARALDALLGKTFEERQIYRIDHFLGKETVQNILAFRFANALFEPIWNRRYIDHVRIDVPETLGVEHRAEYYERSGALRDMIQNHLMQLLCLIAMEPPVSFVADEIRNKKVDVLHAIRPIPSERVSRFAVRGQYGAGSIQGVDVPAYRNEPGIDPASVTETFASVEFSIDNWRWQDVPFYLRTGKRLSTSASEISIVFRPVPHQAFPESAVTDFRPNRLTIRIQPKEGIALRCQAKRPGFDVRLSPIDLEFCYKDAFKTEMPEAYETLLLDVMQGDPTLFMRADQIEAAWSLMSPILKAWESTPPTDFPNYAAGSSGPES